MAEVGQYYRVEKRAETHGENITWSIIVQLASLDSFEYTTAKFVELVEGELDFEMPEHGDLFIPFNVGIFKHCDPEFPSRHWMCSFKLKDNYEHIKVVDEEVTDWLP